VIGKVPGNAYEFMQPIEMRFNDDDSAAGDDGGTA
jgi:hypothetical protein